MIKVNDVSTETGVDQAVVQKVLKTHYRLVLQDVALNGLSSTVFGEMYLSPETGGLQIAQQNADLREVLTGQVPRGELTSRLEEFVLKRW
jgi:hypothetical protein